MNVWGQTRALWRKHSELRSREGICQKPQNRTETEIKAGLEFATSCWEIQITAVRFSRRLDCVDDVIDNCYTLFPTIPAIAGRDNSNCLCFLKEKHCTLFLGSFNIAQVYYLKNFIIFYHFTFYHNFKSRWYLVYLSGIQQFFLKSFDKFSRTCWRYSTHWLRKSFSPQQIHLLVLHLVW